MAFSLKNLRKRLSRDPLTRRKAQGKYFERRLRRHDLQLYKSHLNWTLSGTLKDLHAEWGDAPGLPADRCCFLYDLARLARHRGVPGDSAECGVRYGKSTFFLLRGLDDPARPHHLFDSFAGLSATGAADSAASGLKSWREGDISVPESAARENLARFPNCEFRVGWIPERFPEVADRRFALVHIDVDLYQPTRDALEFFWPRLTPGGLIVCDDYGFATCPGATQAFDEFFAERRDGVLPIPTGQCLVWKDAAAVSG
ncbi:MAG: TylF/MycF/NovP-related O-methyltransferase [Pseudomonadales bacterium]